MVSVGIAGYITSLVGSAIVYFLVVVKFGSEIHARAQAAGSGSVADNGTAWLWTAGSELLPLVFLLTATFGLLAYAVYLRAVSG